MKKSRTHLMGMAIIWVAIFHTGLLFPKFEVANFFLKIGYGGVDIFLLLSGFGLYFSLDKNRNLLEFYKRRFERILPAYLPIILIFEICLFLWGKFHIVDFLGNLTMTGIWTGLPGQFNWYIQAICFLYLLTPIFYDLVKRGDHGKTLWIQFFAILCFTILMSVSYSGNNPGMTAITRIPVFYLGFLFAQKSTREEEFVWRKSYTLIMIVGFILLYLALQFYPVGKMWDYGLWWWPFIMITPGLVMLLTKLENRFPNSFIMKMFYLIGNCCFEVYLVHLLTFKIIEHFYKHSPKIEVYELILLPAIILVSFLYHKLLEIIIRKIKNRMNSKGLVHAEENIIYPMEFSQPANEQEDDPCKEN